MAAVLLVQAGGAGAAESRFWEERRRSSRSASSDGALLAALPKTAGETERVLQGLPALSHVSESLRLNLPADLPPALAALMDAVPAAHGTLRRLVLPEGPVRAVVLHVQDVHQNADAQANIGRALEAAASSRRAPDLVALEGAFAPLSLEGFRSFPDRRAVRLTADYLLREHRISGAAHAAMTSPAPFPPLIGVDDAAHHAANVGAFRRSSPLIPALTEKIAAAARAMADRKAAAYNADLKAFDQAVQKYRRQEVKLGEHVRFLAGASFRPELSAAVRGFLEALAMESAMDFPRAEADRARLVSRLVEALDRPAMDELLRRSVLYKSGRLGHSEYYRHLRDLCRRHGVDLSRTPAMDAYIRYVLVSDAVDAEALFDDLQALEAVGYAALARSPEEKALAAEDRRLHLTAKLADFSLTPEEWAELERLGPAPGLGDLSSFTDFYREAIARDRAMAGNLLQALAAAPSAAGDGVKTAVLVTGGFHAPGMERRLKAAGVASIAFVPRIASVDAGGGAAALGVFTQEKSPLDQLFAGRDLFLSAPPASKDAVRRGGVVLAGTVQAGSSDPDITNEAGIVSRAVGAPFPLRVDARKTGVPRESTVSVLNPRTGGRSGVKVRVKAEGEEETLEVSELPLASDILGFGVRIDGWGWKTLYYLAVVSAERLLSLLPLATLHGGAAWGALKTVQVWALPAGDLMLLAQVTLATFAVFRLLHTLSRLVWHLADPEENPWRGLTRELREDFWSWSALYSLVAFHLVYLLPLPGGQALAAAFLSHLGWDVALDVLSSRRGAAAAAPAPQARPARPAAVSADLPQEWLRMADERIAAFLASAAKVGSQDRLEQVQALKSALGVETLGALRGKAEDHVERRVLEGLEPAPAPGITVEEAEAVYDRLVRAWAKGRRLDDALNSSYVRSEQRAASIPLLESIARSMPDAAFAEFVSYIEAAPGLERGRDHLGRVLALWSAMLGGELPAVAGPQARQARVLTEVHLRLLAVDALQGVPARAVEASRLEVSAAWRAARDASAAINNAPQYFFADWMFEAFKEPLPATPLIGPGFPALRRHVMAAAFRSPGVADEVLRAAALPGAGLQDLQRTILAAGRPFGETPAWTAFSFPLAANASLLREVRAVGAKAAAERRGRRAPRVIPVTSEENEGFRQAVLAARQAAAPAQEAPTAAEVAVPEPPAAEPEGLAAELVLPSDLPAFPIQVATPAAEVVAAAPVRTAVPVRSRPSRTPAWLQRIFTRLRPDQPRFRLPLGEADALDLVARLLPEGQESAADVDAAVESLVRLSALMDREAFGGFLLHAAHQARRDGAASLTLILAAWHELLDGGFSNAGPPAGLSEEARAAWELARMQTALYVRGEARVNLVERSRAAGREASATLADHVRCWQRVLDLSAGAAPEVLAFARAARDAFGAPGSPRPLPFAPVDVNVFPELRGWLVEALDAAPASRTGGPLSSPWLGAVAGRGAAPESIELEFWEPAAPARDWRRDTPSGVRPIDGKAAPAKRAGGSAKTIGTKDLDEEDYPDGRPGKISQLSEMHDSGEAVRMPDERLAELHRAVIDYAERRSISSSLPGSRWPDFVVNFPAVMKMMREANGGGTVEVYQLERPLKGPDGEPLFATTLIQDGVMRIYVTPEEKLRHYFPDGPFNDDVPAEAEDLVHELFENGVLAEDPDYADFAHAAATLGDIFFSTTLVGNRIKRNLRSGRIKTRRELVEIEGATEAKKGEAQDRFGPIDEQLADLAVGHAYAVGRDAKRELERRRRKAVTEASLLKDFDDGAGDLQVAYFDREEFAGEGSSSAGKTQPFAHLEKARVFVESFRRRELPALSESPLKTQRELARELEEKLRQIEGAGIDLGKAVQALVDMHHMVLRAAHRSSARSDVFEVPGRTNGVLPAVMDALDAVEVEVFPVEEQEGADEEKFRSSEYRWRGERVHPPEEASEAAEDFFSHPIVGALTLLLSLGLYVRAGGRLRLPELSFSWPDIVWPDAFQDAGRWVDAATPAVARAWEFLAAHWVEISGGAVVLLLLVSLVSLWAQHGPPALASFEMALGGTLSLGRPLPKSVAARLDVVREALDAPLYPVWPWNNKPDESVPNDALVGGYEDDHYWVDVRVVLKILDLDLKDHGIPSEAERRKDEEQAKRALLLDLAEFLKSVRFFIDGGDDPEKAFQNAMVVAFSRQRRLWHILKGMPFVERPALMEGRKTPALVAGEAGERDPREQPARTTLPPPPPEAPAAAAVVAPSAPPTPPSPKVKVDIHREPVEGGEVLGFFVHDSRSGDALMTACGFLPAGQSPDLRKGGELHRLLSGWAMETVAGPRHEVHWVQDLSSSSPEPQVIGEVLLREEDAQAVDLLRGGPAAFAPGEERVSIFPGRPSSTGSSQTMRRVDTEPRGGTAVQPAVPAARTSISQTMGRVEPVSQGGTVVQLVPRASGSQAMERAEPVAPKEPADDGSADRPSGCRPPRGGRTLIAHPSEEDVPIVSIDGHPVVILRRLALHFYNSKVEDWEAAALPPSFKESDPSPLMSILITLQGRQVIRKAFWPAVHKAMANLYKMDPKVFDSNTLNERPSADGGPEGRGRPDGAPALRSRGHRRGTPEAKVLSSPSHLMLYAEAGDSRSLRYLDREIIHLTEDREAAARAISLFFGDLGDRDKSWLNDIWLERYDVPLEQDLRPSGPPEDPRGTDREPPSGWNPKNLSAVLFLPTPDQVETGQALMSFFPPVLAALALLVVAGAAAVVLLNAWQGWTAARLLRKDVLVGNVSRDEALAALDGVFAPVVPLEVADLGGVRGRAVSAMATLRGMSDRLARASYRRAFRFGLSRAVPRNVDQGAVSGARALARLSADRAAQALAARLSADGTWVMESRALFDPKTDPAVREALRLLVNAMGRREEVRRIVLTLRDRDVASPEPAELARLFPDAVAKFPDGDDLWAKEHLGLASSVLDPDGVARLSVDELRRLIGFSAERSLQIEAMREADVAKDPGDANTTVSTALLGLAESLAEVLRFMGLIEAMA